MSAQRLFELENWEDPFDDVSASPAGGLLSLPRQTIVTSKHYDLFPYQRQSVADIEAAFDEGEKGVLLEAPTGAGKTVMFCTFTQRQIEAGKRVLILINRDILIDQAREELDDAGLYPLIEKANDHAYAHFPTFGRLVLASVQTMRKERLLKWAHDAFDYTISDEAHGVCAHTWADILNHFSTAQHLGVTATPDRADGQNLGRIFQKHICHLNLVDAVENGYLVKPNVKIIQTEIDLSKVGTKDGDLERNALESEVKRHTEELASKIKQHNQGRKTVAFTPRVDSAEALAMALRHIGVTAQCISYKSENPQDIIRAFKRGDFQVLTNAKILCEGFNVRDIGCIALAAPTKSRGRYVQMFGRGLRTHPESGKKDCLFLDFACISGKHKLVTSVELFDDRPPADESAKERQDVQALAQQLLKDENGISPLSALKKAREQIEADKAKRAAREAQRQAQLEAQRERYSELHTSEKIIEFDPLAQSVLGLSPRPIKEHEKFIEGASDAQKNYITKLSRGKIKTEGMSKRTACAVIGQLKSAMDEGRASYGQRELMVSRLKVDPKVAAKMSFEEASAYIQANKTW